MVDVDDIPVELSPDEEETREKLWVDADAQTLLRSLARLRNGNPLVERDDILDDLEEAANYSLPKTKLQILLKKFCDNSLITRVKGLQTKEAQYKVPIVDHLVSFMNPEKGLIPDILEEDDESIYTENGNSPDSQLGDTESKVNQETPGTSTEASSIGTRGAPIVIDLCDGEHGESSLSSISMTSNPVSEPMKTRVVSPEKKERDIESILEPSQYIGKRVAKIFDEDGKLYFGTIAGYRDDEEFWVIVYDDDDNEDFEIGDLHRGLRLYKQHSGIDHSKPSSTTDSSSRLTCIDGIPMVDKSDTSITRTCIEQPEKKRRIYYAGENDTPTKIAKRLNVDVKQIIRDNKRRPIYKSLRKSSKFTCNSPIVLPLKSKK